MAWKVNVPPPAPLKELNLDKEKWRARIAYWKEYPDKFYDSIESKDADFSLNYYQRRDIRMMIRYKQVFHDASRGTTKTYENYLAAVHICIFYPGSSLTLLAPTKEQSHDIYKEAMIQALKNYPSLAYEFNVAYDNGDSLEIHFKNGSKIVTSSARNSMRGLNPTHLMYDEFAQKEAEQKSSLFATAVLPSVRRERFVRGKTDPFELKNRHLYLTSCSSQQSYAFSVWKSTFKAMLASKSAIVWGNDWELPVKFGVRSQQWADKLRDELTPLEWQQEMESIWTGTVANCIVKDTVLAKSRCLKIAQFQKEKEKDIHVLVYDIGQEEGQDTAESAVVDIVMTPMPPGANNQNYGKHYFDVVFLQTFRGFNPSEQAKFIKYQSGQFDPMRVGIDSNGYGDAVRSELMKDLGDGFPPFGVMNTDKYDSRRLANASNILYAVKSNTAEDRDSDMIRNAEIMFSQGRVRLLCEHVEGIAAYKKHHKIKDDLQDVEISYPYIFTTILCEQIANLKKEDTSYKDIKERRISKSIARDIWSALKYGLWICKQIEIELFPVEIADDGWQKFIEERKARRKAKYVDGHSYRRTDALARRRI